VKLVSFEVTTAIGTVVRIGALDEAGRYVDLQSSYAGFLGSIGATPAGAGRIAGSVFPSDMVAFIEVAKPRWMPPARQSPGRPSIPIRPPMAPWSFTTPPA
jgi:hypothetical protein